MMGNDGGRNTGWELQEGEPGSLFDSQQEVDKNSPIFKIRMIRLSHGMANEGGKD